MSTVVARRSTPVQRSSARPMARLVVAVSIIVAAELTVIALRRVDHARLGVLVAVLVFGLLGFWCRRSVAVLGLRTVAVIAAVVQIPGPLVRPLLSDDSYRYVWDGRVQLAGIDPYRYPPLSPVLARLRDPVLFPPGSALPLINRPWVHTIYPPVAELWFTMIAAVTPWRVGVLGLQLASAVTVVITTVVIAKVLSRTPAGQPGWALAYGACPATVIEASNGAHVDALAALLLAIMGWAVITNRHWLAGVLLGLAGGVKLVPMLLLPVFIRRQPLRTAATSVATLVAGYLPHLIVVGSLVLGYLPGYLNEEGFDGQRRFALLILLPEPARLPVALAIAAGCAVLALLRSSEPVLITCCWLYGAAFLVATPAYPWYLLPFMVLVVLARRFEWLSLWPAAYFGYLHDHDPVLQTIGYGAALAIILVSAAARRRSAAESAR